MNSLSDENRRRLLNAAKKIHANKQVQVIGFRALAEKTGDEKIRYLFKRIGDEEARLVEFWSKRIGDLGGAVASRSLLRDWKAKLLMKVLGTKGFFEWALLGEEEGIEDLAIQVEKIRDMAMSETWSRFASDERMRLERMRSEVLGMDEWRIFGGSGVRDMALIFSGAYGGLVSTLTFVAGVVGATMDPIVVLVSGVAGLFAGMISTGAGGYQSSQSELEVLVQESQRDEAQGRTILSERDKLIEFYRSEGYTHGEALAMVKRIFEEAESPIKDSALEELGLTPVEFGNPVKSGMLCGVSFGLAAIIPLFPFAVKTLKVTNSLLVSIIATLASLFCLGAMKTVFSRKKWIRSGLDMVLFGASATAATYLIGNLFSYII